MQDVHRMDMNRFVTNTKISSTSTRREILREAFYRRISMRKRSLKSLRAEIAILHSGAVPEDKTKMLKPDTASAPSVQDQDENKTFKIKNAADEEGVTRLKRKRVCSKNLDSAEVDAEKIERAGMKKRGQRKKIRKDDGESDSSISNGNSTTDDGGESSSGLNDLKRKGKPPDI